jgi:hypothetical protein
MIGIKSSRIRQTPLPYKRPEGRIRQSQPIRQQPAVPTDAFAPTAQDLKTSLAMVLL